MGRRALIHHRATIAETEASYSLGGNVNGGLSAAYLAANLCTTLTAPTAGIVTTMVLQSVASGLFQVFCSGTVVVGAVESAGATVTLETAVPVTPGVGIVVANSTGSQNNVYGTNTGANPAITLSAASGSLGSEVVQCQQAGLNGLASSALQSPFAVGGIIGATAGGARVAKGSWIAISLALTVATTTITLSNYTVSAYELGTLGVNL